MSFNVINNSVYSSENNEIKISSSIKFEGIASYYHQKFEGRKTATGEIFSHSKYTCACNKLPLNSYVKVTNISNGKSVVLKVNDRLAANNKRLVDLTYKAAKKIGSIQQGLAKVKVEMMAKDDALKEINNQ